MIERVVYVDENGTPTGLTAEKFSAHNANTKLHLAFSCYIFNDNNELLVTQRAIVKKVWPGVWTNSVCGHPAPGEPFEDAIQRRLNYELGMNAADIQLILPEYRYVTPPFKGVIENEYCPVFVAHTVSIPKPNPDEVDAFKWMKWEDFLITAINDQEDEWSWWCKDQAKKLQTDQKFKDYLA